MEENAGPHLVVFLIFASLGVYFLLKSITGRRGWSWGRVGGEVPLSRVSHLIVSFAFFIITAILVTAPKPPLWLAALLIVSFLSIIASGFFDTYKYRKKAVASQRRKDGSNK